MIETRKSQLEQAVINEKLKSETVDVIDDPVTAGTPHIIIQIMDDLGFFMGMGHQVLTGPEVEEDRTTLK